VPYAVGESGDPLYLLSELAEHTRNLRADPRASLLVQDSLASADPQAGARVTLLGTAEPHDSETSRKSYVSRHPQAAEYLSLGDFKVWRLNVTEARYVGGFGEMGWLDGLDLRAALAE
jgi:putative heme iron utilization protein